MFRWLRRLTSGSREAPFSTANAACTGDPPKALHSSNRDASVNPLPQKLAGAAGNIIESRLPAATQPRRSQATKLPYCGITVRCVPHGGASSIVTLRPPRKDEARWVPPGILVNVNGFDIPSGMVYVGSFISGAPGGGWNADNPAPCLINPSLKIASGQARTDVDMGYWPSYSDITPEHRLTYLTWLSTGKSEVGFPVGYAFLYFYGLERRLLAENPPPQEEALLIAEVERLRALFAANSSFGYYSRSLVDIVHLRRLSIGTDSDAWAPNLNPVTRELPLPLRVVLGMHALAGVPLDFEHAMAAMLTMPPYQGGIRSTRSTTRCRVEYIELVRKRFAKRFPQGFLLRDRKDSALMLAYRPASQHLEVEVRIAGVNRLPDPCTLTWTKMTELCIKAVEDLAPFAKAIGKDRIHADSLEAALLLPAEFADEGKIVLFKQWLASLSLPVAEVPLATLGRWCLGESREVVGGKQARDMSAMLARVGYGMEPDPSHDGDKPGERVMLFRTDGAAPGPGFLNAALVSAVLGSVKPGPVGARVVSELALRLRLTLAEAVRLAARHRANRGRAVAPAKFKAIAAKLSADERGAIAAMSASVAASCGDVDHQTVAALERLHDAFGVERRSLYAALHQGAAVAATRPAEPVVVESSAPTGGRFRIPPPPKLAATNGGLVIDMAKVGAILRETREVAEVLAPIYVDEDQAPQAPEPPPADAAPARAERFPGLDADHASLLGALCDRASWQRSAFEAKAREFGLMSDGAIETINEWAYDVLGDELVEDGDPLSVNLALLSEAPGAA